MENKTEEELNKMSKEQVIDLYLQRLKEYKKVKKEFEARKKKLDDLKALRL